MEQFETSVSTVMSFLNEENFSASVISLHRLCYRAIATYLSSNMLEYSPDIGYQWIAMYHGCWNYRKYTGFKHCIDQLNDVFLNGKISLDHLSPRCSAYSLLSTEYKSILDRFISDTNCTDDRYRIACSRFLLYMQNNNISDISELTYESIIHFHNDDYHRVQKSKDTYEDLIRVFLRYLASINLCDIDLSLALNKLLIDKIILIPQEDIHRYDCNSNAFEISWIQARSFISELKNLGYGKTVINSSKHILTLLYIFLQMHQAKLNEHLLWYWYDNVKPLLGSNYKQHRRSLYQFMEYIKSGVIVTSVTGDPNAIKAIDTMPDWIATPLRNYLELLKRENWQPSTIAMHKSSNLRFCKYLLKIGICNFSDLTPEVINDFNLQDNHNTSEGKAAYNCRIRSFIIYLFEQKLITNAYLYKALPTFVSNTVSIVQTLSKEDVSTIWSVDPEILSPKALRDYAMVCIGLTMGFRACDIVSLRFDVLHEGYSLKTFSFDKCSRDFLLGFMEYLQSEGYEKSSCNQRLAAIKSYMWYVADGNITWQQNALMVSRVPFLKNPEKEKAILSDRCLKALLSAPDNSRIGIRDATIMITLYDSAIRLSELLELKVSDVNLSRNTPYLRIHGKGDKERIVSVSDNAAKHLENYIQ